MESNELFKDIILKEIPKKSIVKEESWIFFQKKYGEILQILKSTPMTFDEIFSVYKSKSSKEKSPKKSYTTIYRLFTELIKNEFVIEVGKRVKKHQTQSKVLYSRKSKLILFDCMEMDFWTEESSISLATVVSLIVKKNLLKMNPSDEKLIKFYYENAKQVQTFRETILLDIYDENSESMEKNLIKIRDSFEILDLNAFYKFYKIIGILVWIFNLDINNMTSNLSNCFIERAETEKSNEELNLKENSSNYFIYYQPMLYKPLDAEIFDAVVKNINLRTIMHLLRQKPLTLKEIHEKYYQASLTLFKEWKDKLSKVGLKEPKPKAENTIYYYIKDLIEKGIILEAGKKTVPNQIATQTLYGRAAKSYYRISDESIYWRSEEATNTIKALGQCLNYYFETESFDLDLFKDLIVRFCEEQQKSLVNALNEARSEDFQAEVIFRDKDATIFLNVLSLYKWLFTSDYLNSMKSDLENIFKSNK